MGDVGFDYIDSSGGFLRTGVDTGPPGDPDSAPAEVWASDPGGRASRTSKKGRYAYDGRSHFYDGPGADVDPYWERRSRRLVRSIFSAVCHAGIRHPGLYG